MSLSSAVIKIPKWMIIITYLLNLPSDLYFMFTELLTHLGLLRPLSPPNSEEHQTNYVTSALYSSPDPVYAIISLIKKRLPVVEHGKLLARYKAHEDNNVACAVCLDCIDERQEVRELYNCSHVFHRDCLDRWMDEGQIICPLCRSMLYPAPAKVVEEIQ